MKNILDFSVAPYLILLITRGWLNYCYKIESISFKNFIKNISKINRIICMVDFRLALRNHELKLILNILTIVLYLFMFSYIVYPIIIKP